MTQSRNYKYSLDTSSKKYKCPECGKKRLVAYKETATGNTMPTDKYGRCDRQDACSFHEYPNTGSTRFVDSNQSPVLKSVVKKTITIPNQTVEASIGISKEYTKTNNLFKYLNKFFNEKEILEVFSLFKIGTIKSEFYFSSTSKITLEGCTVFWYIDTKGKAKFGQRACFNPDSGSTMKHEGNRCTRPVWTHYDSVHKKTETTTTPEWVEECKARDNNIDKIPIPFGYHQIADKPLRKPIAIVEAPKTAIVGTLLFPELTWLAITSESYLKFERLEMLKEHRIILFPDKGDAYKNWRKKAYEFRKRGLMVTISRVVEKIESLKDGDDIADILNHSKQLTTNDEL